MTVILFDTSWTFSSCFCAVTVTVSNCQSFWDAFFSPASTVTTGSEINKAIVITRIPVIVFKKFVIFIIASFYDYDMDRNLLYIL